MTISIESVRRQVAADGNMIDLPFGRGVFDVAAVAEHDRLNLEGLTVAPRFADAVRGRADRCPVLWADVRARLFAATRQLDAPTPLLELYAAMQAVAAREAGPQVDLTLFTERVICEPLIDLVIGGLSRRERATVLADQRAKIANVLHPPQRLLRGVERLFPRIKKLRDVRREVAAGFAVRRALARRVARGATRAPDGRPDYAAAVLDLHERLGTERAAYIVGTILTAIVGAPGTVAACILFELLRANEWRARVAEELAAVPLEDLVADPTRAAPLTYCALREGMRLWSFPLMIGRPAYRTFTTADGREMPEGSTYWLSSYLMHRDPAHWSHPDDFDPDRWGGEQATRRGSFVPFGWTGRTCVGATLGLAQQFLFLRLVLVDWRLTPDARATARMGLDGVAAPEDMSGAVSRADAG
jgi:cytochrome P450